MTFHQESATFCSEAMPPPGRKKKLTTTSLRSIQSKAIVDRAAGGGCGDVVFFELVGAEVEEERFVAVDVFYCPGGLSAQYEGRKGLKLH